MSLSFSAEYIIYCSSFVCLFVLLWFNDAFMRPG